MPRLQDSILLSLDMQDQFDGSNALHCVFEMEQGLIDADLGGSIVKKRIALPGRGKSGGVRTLVVTNNDTRWFFIFGFEKNERANVSNKELKALQTVGADLLKLTAAQLDTYVADDALQEICHDHQD